jgi:hypothetical protein
MGSFLVAILIGDPSTLLPLLGVLGGLVLALLVVA